MTEEETVGPRKGEKEASSQAQAGGGEDGGEGGYGPLKGPEASNGSRRERELVQEVQELQKRIADLEGMFAQVLAPLSAMKDASKGYFRMMELYLRHGRISPEMIAPGLKDDISKEILRVLFEHNGQNISQITEAVKDRRGTASRRIVRSRLQELESRGIVVRRARGKIDHYHISEEMVKKWSQVLGLH